MTLTVMRHERSAGLHRTACMQPSHSNAPVRSRQRKLDLFCALLILPFVVLMLVMLVPVVLMLQGRPFLFGSRRIGRGGQIFTMWKIRTMIPSGADETVLGADPERRVTPVGAWLRKTRLDELPQIFNVLRGEMQFIGVRPPFPDHVEAAPEAFHILLGEPPGVTGLGTIYLCTREAHLMAGAKDDNEAEAIYRGKCLPKKLRLDRFYHSKGTASLVLLILIRTIFRSTQPIGRLRRTSSAPRFLTRVSSELTSNARE